MIKAHQDHLNKTIVKAESLARILTIRSGDRNFDIENKLLFMELVEKMPLHILEEDDFMQIMVAFATTLQKRKCSKEYYDFGIEKIKEKIKNKNVVGGYIQSGIAISQCMHCKKIHCTLDDDKEHHWIRPEDAGIHHPNNLGNITHGICPDCLASNKEVKDNGSN